MHQSLAEILQFIEDNDIKFIRLAFCDIFGVQKNIAIMSSQLAYAVEQGISFDASAIGGFSNVAESDLFLYPDLDTLSLLPWRPSQGCVARFFCHIRYPDGRPFEGDGRYLLRQVMSRAAGKGFSFQVGPECEFYLFKTDAEGEPTLEPHDRAGYFDIAPMDRGENVRRDICLALEEMGIQPERSHHEQGPGQNEIDFHCSSPLRAADHLMTLRTAVKAIAAQNGLFASFLPKPLEDVSGSGLHINLSLYKDDKNLFEDFALHPQEQAAGFLAGILRYIAEITAFANPLPGSYLRLGKSEAPAAVNWSCQNRSTLVRVPAATGGDSRIEVRSPDPSCNPYFTIALLLEAGLEGIEKKLPLPPSSDFNTYVEDLERHGLDALPRTLGDALAIAESSAFIRRVLPQQLIEPYIGQKRMEFSQYDNAGRRREYEIRQYFDRI